MYQKMVSPSPSWPLRVRVTLPSSGHIFFSIMIGAEEKIQVGSPARYAVISPPVVELPWASSKEKTAVVPLVEDEPTRISSTVPQNFMPNFSQVGLAEEPTLMWASAKRGSKGAAPVTVLPSTERVRSYEPGSTVGKLRVPATCLTVAMTWCQAPSFQSANVLMPLPDRWRPRPPARVQCTETAPTDARAMRLTEGDEVLNQRSMDTPSADSRPSVSAMTTSSLPSNRIA
mmetsp:Transcript_17509/g.56375  ORF Transcript_17509/g.56375 Transcript_17509/m.56375 type:complete len:230 (+) Transcript_17509:11938-12627(+)